MAFKMKGHTLPGPYQQKKQIDKANAAAQAARDADKEFKTFAYDYAEPGTARADSLGGSYNEENMKRFNELGGIREKAYKAYEKAADKAKKKGAISSPAKQRKTHPEDQKYGPTERTKRLQRMKEKERMEKECTGRSGKLTGKRGRGLKEADLETLSKTGSKFNKKDIKSPAKKKSPYKVAPIVAKLAPKVIGAVASSAMSKKDD